MRAKDGRIEEGHYLRERAAPGGRAVAWGSARTLEQVFSEFHNSENAAKSNAENLKKIALQSQQYLDLS